MAKGNRNSRTGEGRDRDAGCSIIHGSIKDAQALGLSAGFWPLYRETLVLPFLLQQPIQFPGHEEAGAGDRELVEGDLLTPAGVHLLVYNVIFPFISLIHF